MRAPDPDIKEGSGRAPFCHYFDSSPQSSPVVTLTLGAFGAWRLACYERAECRQRRIGAAPGDWRRERRPAIAPAPVRRAAATPPVSAGGAPPAAWRRCGSGTTSNGGSASTTEREARREARAAQEARHGSHRQDVVLGFREGAMSPGWSKRCPTNRRGAAGRQQKPYRASKSRSTPRTSSGSSRRNIVYDLPRIWARAVGPHALVHGRHGTRRARRLLRRVLRRRSAPRARRTTTLDWYEVVRSFTKRT